MQRDGAAWGKCRVTAETPLLPGDVCRRGAGQSAWAGMWVHQSLSPQAGTSLCPSQLRNSLCEQAVMEMLSGDIAALAVALAAPQS